MIKKIFPIIALAVFSSMLGVGIIAPILPLYADNLGATGIWLGIIFAGLPFSRAIFMPIMGRLSDRFGRKIFIAIGLFIYCVSSIGLILADSVWELTTVRLAQGFAASMIIPIAEAYVGDLSPVGKEGTWMGYYYCAFLAGFGAGPFIGGVLSDHLSMDAAFIALGGLNFLALLVVIFFLPETQGRKTESSRIPSFKTMGRSGVVRGLFVFRFSFYVGSAAFVTFLPIFAAHYLNLTATYIGILLGVNILLVSFFEIYGGYIADRFNRKLLIVAGSLVNLVWLALIPQAHSFGFLLGLCIVGGLAGAIALPAAGALVVEEGRKFGMGSTFAIYAMAMSLGMGIGPLACGAISDWINIDSVFYFAAMVGLAGTALFIWLTRNDTPRSIRNSP